MTTWRPAAPIALGELVDRLRERGTAHFWNVLTDDEPDRRLIPGSRRVPLDRVVRSARELALAGGAEIVVYGSGPGCPQGRLAAEKLAAAGYENVRCFEGGLEAWGVARRPFEPPALAN